MVLRRGSESVILTTRLIVARWFLISLLLLLLRFTTPAIVVGKPFPATSFPIIKFRKEMKPAALLAKSLSQPGGNDGGCFRVKLTNLVSSVVVFGVCEVSIASFSLASWGVQGARFSNSGPAIEPANEIVLRRRKISPSTQIKPNPTTSSEIKSSN